MPVFTVTANLERTLHTDLAVNVQADTEEAAKAWVEKNAVQLSELGHGDEEQDGPSRLLGVNVVDEAEEGDYAEPDYHTKDDAETQYLAWLDRSEREGGR
jgi:hypothetical protein